MPVTLDQLKDHLRITWDDEDSILTIYLESAVDYIKQYTGREITRDNRDSYFSEFSSLELIGDNAQNVVINYVDSNGEYQVLPSERYIVNQHKARPYITLNHGEVWPTVRYQDGAIRINYDSGYDSSTLPSTLRAAILIEAATQYEFRENDSLIKTHDRKTVKRLASPYRIYNL